MAAKKSEKRDLPKDIKASDLEYPKDYEKALRYSDYTAMGLETPSLLMYKTDKHWVVCVLHISSASRANKSRGVTADRYYAIGVDDKKIYTVGRGLHVKDEITVHLTKDNIDRLMPYVELYKKGNADANTIRDRVSSRRAMGALYRAEGRTSWMW